MRSNSFYYRKGFLKRAGAAVFSMFVASSASRSGSYAKFDSSSVVPSISSPKRVQAARGAIERKV